MPCEKGKYATGLGSPACTPCGIGSYSTGTGITTSATCAECSPGAYADVSGSTTCTLCAAGSFIGSYGGGARKPPCENCSPKSTFAPNAGSSICTGCKGAKLTCPIAGTFVQDCTISTDDICSSCEIIANCAYQSSTCNNANGSPACICVAGYEMAGRACVPCQAGNWRPTNENTNKCAPWTVRDCGSGAYYIIGTATTDSFCQPCPTLPANTEFSGIGCRWNCVSGFESA